MSRIGLTSSFICLFLLSGCSWLGDWPKSSSEDSSSVRVVQPGDGTYASLERKGLEMPPMYGQSPSRPQGVEPLAPLAPALPSEPVTQVMAQAPDAMEQRIERLEASVLQMHSALEKMEPALQRLAGLEVSIESLLGGIAPAAGNSNNVPQGYSEVPSGYSEYVGYSDRPPPPQNIVPQQQAIAPLSAPVPSVQQTSQHAAMSQSHKGFVENVRVGEHPGKTRLVLDTSGSLAFDVRQEGGGRVLVIDLPTAGWRTSPLLQISNSPLIESFASQTNGQGGTRFTVQLKRGVQVLWAESLKPSGIQGHRIVVDLAAG